MIIDLVSICAYPLLDYYIHMDIYLYFIFDLNYIFHHQVYISRYMEYVFFSVSDSFILVIMLKTLKFTSPVLFRTHIPLEKSLRVLPIPLHLSKLTKNEANEVHLNLNQ